ncbi:methylase of chemotaxis methyl-accepting protein [Candidatus Methanoperedens nitroreducens]|uniref:protein-glutamate O-methyltransferase n=1 Tax=Candidatus Methanoperedens nitratireducens TaxID=1392998 RepID=A0A062V166_9EURY|nr:protein-glutamate O-methyltransferase CheR [Candidatus Methanoperedens nitroreducens]KCZ71127.1 methylase of chemotaxis methyl-accepting protein [Candidatus Methanoperedens nitroreducens]MDJ1421495.1 protein-glutamate O-methyltransferase CheR [Candidatus Methanoperedens sp.]
MNLPDTFPLHEDEKEFAGLKAIIKKKTGFNCDEYKQAHLKRRLAVRLRANGSKSYNEYAEILLNNNAELQKLKETLTVNVTELFRNPETYEAFSRIALPVMIKAKVDNRSIRVWSAGCSNGEEPYSIAIMLLEFLGASARRYNISILGTDIDEDSLKKGENGIYQLKQLEKTGKDRLGRFFIKKDDDSYQVTDEIRSLVRFRYHDMISGPVLYGFDIIFCRNVTIYFEQKLQGKLYLDFYNALNEGGYFVMGKTETLTGQACRLFKAVDIRERIYQKER